MRQLCLHWVSTETSATILSSREAPRKIPCLHNSDYLAAVNNNTWDRTVSKNTSSNICVYALCASAVIFCAVTVQSVRTQLTVIQKGGNDFSRAWLYARLAGHMETHPKRPEGLLGVKTIREAVPAKWDEKDRKKNLNMCLLLKVKSVLSLLNIFFNILSANILIVALAHVLVHWSGKPRHLCCFRSSSLLLSLPHHFCKFIYSHYHNEH